MTYTLGQTSLAHLSQVHPDLVLVVKRAITLTTQDFCVFDGARTAAEQNTLYRRGVTQKDGYKNKSNHQITADGYGHSVDLVPWVNGAAFWDDSWTMHYPIAYAMAQAAVQMSVNVKWGGNWYDTLNTYATSLDAVKQAVARYKADHPGPDFIDAPHFELA